MNMTTKPDATPVGDAPASERRSTDPGLGDKVASNAEPTKSAKQFEDTLPPTDVADVLGDSPELSFAGLPHVGSEVCFPKVEVKTALEIPHALSTLPAVRRAHDSEAIPLKAISYRLAVPLAILIFAAGALLVLLLARGHGPGTHAEAFEVPKAVAAPNPATQQAEAAPTVAQAPTILPLPSAEAEAVMAAPKRRTAIASKPQPRALVPSMADAQKPRVRNEEPE
jgi:hypothetical protein